MRMKSLFNIGETVRIDGHAYIVDHILNGGMGIVLLCHSAKDNYSFLYLKRMAVKVFSPAIDAQIIKNELHIWQRLKHPHIARLLSISHVNDWLCATMPWYAGGSITTCKMYDCGGLNIIKKMLVQVVLALQHADSNKILHLDIKPSNILFRNDTFYLSDWGIARLCAEQAINKSPLWGGTIPYMSPERFIPNRTDKLVDIYSLGITAFEMLTGNIPFTDDNIEDMITHIATGQVQHRLYVLTEQLPKNWRMLILACCAYNTKQRPQNYKILLQMINQAEA